MEVKEFTCGEMTIFQQEAWVEKIFNGVKDFIASYGNPDISTCGSLCVTSLKNSYVRGRVYPFINIPIRFREKELLGLYEYCEQLPLSDQYIYCDFVVESIYYAENKEPVYIKALEDRARQLIEGKGYEIVSFEQGMAAITIDRKVLEQETDFIIMLKGLLDEALKMQAETL
jgi:hypothetical protein